jgi:hypothetical protein
MGLMDRLIGHAEVNDASSNNVERFFGAGESVVAAFRFMRDEIVVTNRGIFVVDVQGLTGKKKETKYFPLKGLKYVAFESGGTLDLDADIKIGVDGNTEIVNGIPHNKPLSFKIPKAQSEQGEKFMRLLKAAIDG